MDLSLGKKITCAMLFMKIPHGESRVKGCAVRERLLVDGEERGVRGILRQANRPVAHPHKVVERGRHGFGEEGEVLRPHHRLPVPHIIGAEHFPGHLPEVPVQTFIVDGRGEERAFFVEEAHGGVASLHGCLRNNDLPLRESRTLVSHLTRSVEI